MKIEEEKKMMKGKLELGESFDSGIGINEVESTEDSGEATATDENQDMDENDEIQDFLDNKDLYTGKKLSDGEEFNFDDYEYCYKSFHSPLLDKEFDGLSIDQIQQAAAEMKMKKEEQKKKREISEAVQFLKTRRAMMTWRDKYKKMKQMTAKKYSENDYSPEEEGTEPPYDQDPDWTITNSSVSDKVYHPGAGDKDVKFDEVVRAIEVLEDQIDDEVEKVVRSRPGRVETDVRERRSARIDRLNQRLNTAKKKARIMSANPAARIMSAHPAARIMSANPAARIMSAMPMSANAGK